MNIKDLIIVSDLDGTIIPLTGIISKRNIDAIDKFRSLGGTFTIATGRAPIQAMSIFEKLDIDGAVIANNGAVLYDVRKDENIWIRSFDDEYRKIIIDVKNEFPDIGIIIVSGKHDHYVISSNDTVKAIFEHVKIPYLEMSIDVVESDCCKVIFVDDVSKMSDIYHYLTNKNYEKFSFVLSGKACLEMMPNGISKGYSFEMLVQSYGKRLENSVAIGDYNNDIEMLLKANLSVAVDNALDEVKQVADLVVKSCEEDGVADLIEYLIKNYNNNM